MPDECDWVQVVAEQQCEECGLVSAAIPHGQLGSAIVEEGEQWLALLSHHHLNGLRRRPQAEVWSALEYGAHVRRTRSDRV